MIGSMNRRRGQGMTEYIIIVALVAVALITIISLFGNKIKFLFTGSVNSLDNGKVVDPKSIQDNGMKTALGDDATLDTQNKSHTLQHFKSGQAGD